MIRTDAEYRDALARLEQDKLVATQQRGRLQATTLTAAEIDRAMEPLLSFHQQLVEEVDAYDRMRRGDIDAVRSLADVGRILIGLRIARGLTQRDLAAKLEVSESQVSRDERNDYFGISLARAQRIIDALGGTVVIQAEVPAAETPAGAT